jgi:gamma-glutamyltranspeptidase / glutathione hydrolase
MAGEVVELTSCSMPHVTIASGSTLSAAAGARIADAGGNAVDAAVASTLVSMCTEPGIIAPGAGGFVTVWPATGEPVVIDAYAEMPGRGLAPEEFGGGGIAVDMAYGGGLRTVVGYGSVATPGAIAGLGAAAARYGRLPWAKLVEPAIAAVEAGFPVSQACASYMVFAHDVVFGWDPPSRAALHRDDGAPLEFGDLVHLPELAGSLRLLAAAGPEALYLGELGERIVSSVREHGGILTLDDLAAYRPELREPIVVDLDGWRVASTPPPAVGGTCMAAMLLLLDAARVGAWDAGTIPLIEEIQRSVLQFRRARLDVTAGAGPDEAQHLLAAAASGDPGSLLGSPSTTHTSAVDEDGTACAITVSAGYGSGAMPGETGFWLNNSLGEIELSPAGYHGLAPGTRLISNMAPTIARRKDGAVIAIGTPGADRITTALSSVLYRRLKLGEPLMSAIHAPRTHAEVFEGTPRFAHEPGIDTSGVSAVSPRPFAERSMYFGGVQAVERSPDGWLEGAADDRRVGAVATGGARLQQSQ